MYILGVNMYILGTNIYILGANMYIFGANMYHYGKKVYLFKRYSPSDSFCTFFAESVWTNTNVGLKKCN